jgi:ribonucleoside-diphosphate reductase alpha chain
VPADLETDAIGRGKDNESLPAATTPPSHVVSTGYVRNNFVVLTGGALENVEHTEGHDADVENPEDQRQEITAMTSDGAVAVDASRPATDIGGGASTNASQTGNRSGSREQATQFGYEGDACNSCGNFTMVRNGSCLKCLTCGETTGCS